MANHGRVFFDCFNSLPFIGMGFLVALRVKSRAGQLVCLSMLLHVFGDLPLHHDDGHRHFFPFSDWRFESPVFLLGSVALWSHCVRIRSIGCPYFCLDSFLVFYLSYHERYRGNHWGIVWGLLWICGLGLDVKQNKFFFKQDMSFVPRIAYARLRSE